MLRNLRSSRGGRLGKSQAQRKGLQRAIFPRRPLLEERSFLPFSYGIMSALLIN